MGNPAQAFLQRIKTQRMGGIAGAPSSMFGALADSIAKRNPITAQPQMPTHQPPIGVPPMQFGTQDAVMNGLQNFYAQDSPYRIKRPMW